ncbi:MAG: HAMP domain-containing protein [Candidatus Riflebacteria bacterium]|nr:HAMP domain-containing protein [Candidatus Riflebacteria bacterium]
MYLSLRIKIMFLMFALISSLGIVFSESATRLIRQKTEETFQARVFQLTEGVKEAWNNERNSLLRNAALFAESDRLITYAVYGLYNLLGKEIRRLVSNAGRYEIQIHLKSGVIISGAEEMPKSGNSLDPGNSKLQLSKIDVKFDNKSIRMTAIVPIQKHGEFIGLLKLEKDLNDGVIRELSKLLQVNLAITGKGSLYSSSLPAALKKDFLINYYRSEGNSEKPFLMTMARQRYHAAGIDVGTTDNGDPIIIYFMLSKEKFLSLIESAKEQNLELTIFALTIAYIFAFLFSEKVLISRIRRIRDGSMIIAQENLEFRLPKIWKDELGDLAKSFNEMAEKLSENRKSLVHQNVELQTWVQRLEQMKSYIQDILGSLTTSVITWNQQLIIATVNPAAEKDLHDFFPKLEGLSLRKFVKALDKKNRAIFFSALRDLYEKKVQAMPFDLEFDLGEHRGFKVMQGILSSLRDKNGVENGFILTLEDITQRKIIEQQLYHADKLSSIGQLAASVAHEIKNPLASIKTLGQLLQEETDVNDSRREYIDVIVSEVNRLNGVVEQLLRYAKPEGSSFRKIKFSELIKPVQTLLHHELERNRIELKVEFEELLEVNVDVEKLKQVFLNLIFNAIHAMNAGGCVILRAFHDGATPWTIFQVEDNGTGMPEEIVSRAFDPFFTTKQRGTGLGLAIVKKIVDLHGGKIELKSRSGTGSLFTIYLPKERERGKTDA